MVRLPRWWIALTERDVSGRIVLATFALAAFAFAATLAWLFIQDELTAGDVGGVALWWVAWGSFAALAHAVHRSNNRAGTRPQPRGARRIR